MRVPQDCRVAVQAGRHALHEAAAHGFVAARTATLQS